MKEDEKEVLKNYALSAEKYHNMRTKENPYGWFFNELLEMPSTLKLLGNVKNKKILDFGCGTGIYAKLLTKKGAKVKGFDISPEMLVIAKRENPILELKIGSGYKIPFNEKFDIVTSSLVVHYLKDWNKMFDEIKRVLKKGGVFIFSTGNPVAEMRFGKDYFHDKKTYWPWSDNKNKKMKIPAYHKTYEQIIKDILTNGFEIVDYKDCFPDKKAKKLFPKEYKEFSEKPIFCVWKLKLK